MDVNQIFKELGTMIHEQGETVDSIETNVEYATQNVESGTAQLREAANYKVYIIVSIITYCWVLHDRIVGYL